MKLHNFWFCLITAFLFLICTTSGSAQTNQENMFKKEWGVIDSLESRGLPSSALKELEELNKKINPREQADQYLKVLLYRSKFMASMEEEGLLSAINELEKEATNADFPVKPILQSMLATFYQAYMNARIWEIQNRTALENSPDDIKTWSINDFINKISTLYKVSLEQKTALGTIAITEFPEIIFQGKESEGLRPTLYDLLMHRAIDFFRSDVSDLNSALPAIKITNPEVFGDLKSFVRLPFDQGKGDNLITAIHLLQELFKFRLTDTLNQNALIDLDLKRLGLMYQVYDGEDRDNRYEQALNQLLKTIEGQDAASEVIYKIAEQYYNKGKAYKINEDEAPRWKYKEAFELCNTCKRDYPNSYGAKLCAGLQNRILDNTLAFQVETIVLPGQPILIGVDYKNVDKVYVRAVKITKTDEEALKRRNQTERMAYLLNLKPEQEQSFQLPDPGDFRNHKIELMLESMDLGRYLILMSENERFDQEDYLTLMAYTNVSRIGYMQRRNLGDVEFIVMDRETGLPLEDVLAEFYISEYNSKKQIHDLIKVGETKSDNNGFVKPKVSGRTYWTVKFSKGKDVIHLDDGYRNFNTSRNGELNIRNSASIFLDRAIYRPNQTIYFKGLLLQKDGKGIPTILPNQKVKVSLLDVNYQEVTKMDLQSNEFGSVKGSFIAPAGLTGRMYIVMDVDGAQSQHSFRVEEYKRPKFKVEIEDLDKSYALGDEVSVSAIAQAFAGNPIGGAKVSYTVDRFVEFPWNRYSFNYPANNTSKRVAIGDLITDSEGKVNFSFDAIPSSGNPTKKQVVFKFEVRITVTDITGETHETSKSFRFSELGLIANIQLPSKLIDKQSKQSIKIETTDLNGNFQAAQGDIKVYALENPDQYFINRYWDQPDQFIYDKATFKKAFPLLAYKGEDKPENWTKEKEITTISFNTRDSITMDLDVSNWDVGYYQLELNTKDQGGRTITNKVILGVFDTKARKLPTNQLFYAALDQSRLQPGDEANFRVYTNNEIKLLYEENKNQEVTEQVWQSIKAGSKISREVKEEDRGGYYIQTAFVLNNRFYGDLYPVDVPWDNKKLSITYETFRDKLRPGEEEEWRLKISGPDKDKVMAEMLVTMYDKSLDQFFANNWSFQPYPGNYRPTAYNGIRWTKRHFNADYGQQITYRPYQGYYQGSRSYPSLSFHGFEYFTQGNIQTYANYSADGAVSRSATPKAYSAAPPPPQGVTENVAFEDQAVENEPVSELSLRAAEPSEPESPNKENAPIAPRTNLKETVFFYPDLKTDAEGNIVISFKMNEALTTWKFLGFAHTQDLAFALTEEEIITQKELMVLPNPPRFLRQGDILELTTKVVNLSEGRLTDGIANIELLQASDRKAVTSELIKADIEQNFTIDPGGSIALSWRIQVPEDFTETLIYRITAKAGAFSDGEENAIPVLSNKILLTESRPLALNGKSSTTIELDALNEVLNSETAQPYQFSVEITSNPSWMVVKALPYLMEYPYECTEQVFNRFYANSLASSIANRYPKVQQIFEEWKNTASLESQLTLNPDLKSAIIEETPWVLEAQSEAEQRRNIALLFDLDRINGELFADLQKLSDRQSSDGGFPWFPGGPNNRYITQLVVEGLGHLDYLKVGSLEEARVGEDILPGAIAYMDRMMLEEYQQLEEAVEKNQTTFEEDHLSYMAIHYMYIRSFFPDIRMEESLSAAMAYYEEQAEKYWPKKGLYQQGMIGLSFHRNKNAAQTQEVLKSLKERAIKSDALGIYWKYNRSYWWYELPIETHVMLIEFFNQVEEDPTYVIEMKKWLLKNKQTNKWETTKATSAAVFAFMDEGLNLNSENENWLSDNNLVKIEFPKKRKASYKDKLRVAEEHAESGTGYYKVNWDKSEINGDLTTLKVKNKNSSISWGSAYWQYFEAIDQVQSFEETPLKLKKEIFLELTQADGQSLRSLEEAGSLEVGDQLIVRIELRVDRDMEFVHLKDMRGSGLEPTEVLSGYKWKNGLGYYQSIRDTGVNFFFDYLPKGTYVFEYPLQVIHKGDYPSGIATIQCMYAPEFISHSNSIKLKVGE